jgi:hypothetical protein
MIIHDNWVYGFFEIIMVIYIRAKYLIFMNMSINSETHPGTQLRFGAIFNTHPTLV